MRAVFLRHGPTEWNALGRIQGHTDIPLSAEGLAKMQGLTLPEDFSTALLSSRKRRGNGDPTIGHAEGIDLLHGVSLA